MHDLHAAAGEESIGARIRRLRLERGLSQREISGPGVSYAYVSRIESGHREPSLKAIRTIAGLLGVDPEVIETGELIPAARRRALRVSDAELALRLGLGVEDAENAKTKRASGTSQGPFSRTLGRTRTPQKARAPASSPTGPPPRWRWTRASSSPPTPTCSGRSHSRRRPTMRSNSRVRRSRERR